MTRQEEIKQAFIKAIEEVGLDEFKKCSFFGRNCK
jgi:hypothetical protein